MKHVSKRWIWLALAGAGLLASAACNSNRSDNDSDSAYSTDAAGNPDTANVAADASPYSQTLTFRQYSFTVNTEGEGSLVRSVAKSFE